MRFLTSLIATLCVAGATFAGQLVNSPNSFQSTGFGHSTQGANYSEADIWVPEYLLWPERNGTGNNSSAFLSIIPETVTDYRLKWATTSVGVATGTSIVACSKRQIGDTVETADAACNASVARERLAFHLESLPEDTRIYYRVESTNDGPGGTDWQPRSTFSFKTPGPPGTTTEVIKWYDAHLPQHLVRTNCGDGNDPDYAEWERLTLTVQNMSARRDAVAFIDFGDFAMNDSGAGTQDAGEPNCTYKGLPFNSDWADVGDTRRVESVADSVARYAAGFNALHAVLRQTPGAFMLGNHECEMGFEELVASADVSTRPQWHVDATHSCQYFSLLGRQYMMIPPDNQYASTAGDGDANGYYYSFALAEHEFIIGDPHRFTANTQNATWANVAPQSWDTWTHGIGASSQCNFLTGATLDCSGTGGRFGATEWVVGETLVSKWFLEHHPAGGSTDQTSGYDYGRGIEVRDRTCLTVPGGVPDTVNDCSSDIDCVGFNGCTPGVNCTCQAHTYALPFAGEHEEIYTQFTAWMATGGKMGGLGIGHDHVSVGLIDDVETSLIRWSGTQPVRFQEGANWADSTDYALAHFDLDLDGINDLCASPASVIAAGLPGSTNPDLCPSGADADATGSTIRGFTVLTLTSTTASLSQINTVLSEDSGLGIANQSVEWTLGVTSN